MVQFYIHEYSRYKTGIIHEYSRIYTMNILELFQSIHELFMVKKAGYVLMCFMCMMFYCIHWWDINKRYLLTLINQWSISPLCGHPFGFKPI